MDHKLYKLETTEDLVRKLQHDLKQLREAPNDGYLAFNFFVSAEHVADWLYPGRANRQSRENLRRNNTVLRICSHIANGLKHFNAEARHHDTVKTAENQDGYGDGYYRDYAPSYYGCKIEIALDGDAKDEFGESIDAVSLAEKVVNFWEAEMAKSG